MRSAKRLIQVNQHSGNIVMPEGHAGPIRGIRGQTGINLYRNQEGWNR